MQWAILIGAYFLGAVPVGVLVARAKGVDILKVGSGNIGATNVQRALGKKAGLFVFFMDVLKGLLPALAGRLLLAQTPPLTAEEWAGLAGVCGVLGHCLSPFLGFKGGKGISTGLGALLGASPLVGLSAFGLFLASMFVNRYVSLSSILAAASLPFFAWLYHDPRSLLIAFTVFAAFIIYRHRANIARLRAGTEPKFEWKKDKPAEPEPARYTADLEDNPEGSGEA